MSAAVRPSAPCLAESGRFVHFGTVDSLDVDFAAALDDLEDKAYQDAEDLRRRIRTAGARAQHLRAVVQIAIESGAEPALNVARAIDEGAPDDAVDMLIGLARHAGVSH
jgi:hypothetical protein